MAAVSNGNLTGLRAAALSSKKRKRSGSVEREDGELEEGELSADEAVAPPTAPSAGSRPPAGAYKPLGVIPTGPRKAPDKQSKAIEHRPAPPSAPAPAPPPPLPVVAAPKAPGSAATKSPSLPATVAPPTAPTGPRASIPTAPRAAGNRTLPSAPIAPRSAPPALPVATFTSQLPNREPVRDLIKELTSWGVTPEYLVGYGIAKETVALAFVELGYRLPHNLAYLAEPAAAAVKRAINEQPTPPPVKQRQLPQRPDQQVVDQAILRQVRVPSPLPPRASAELADMEKQRRDQLMARRNERVAVEASIDSLFASAQMDEEENVKPTIAQLREAVIANDELNVMPSNGPFPSGSRPHAEEFERDPTSSSIPPPPSRNGFVPPVELSRPQSLVLELSEEEDLQGEDHEVAHALAIPVAGLLMPDPILASPDARQKLSDKEAEIKRMTAMIEKMEKRNRKGKGKADEVGSGIETPPAAVAPAVQLQEARDKMEQLVEERQEIINQSVADDMLNSIVPMQVEEPPKPDNAIPVRSPLTSSVQGSGISSASQDYVATDYAPYVSAFRSYPESRDFPLHISLISPRQSLGAYVANHRNVESKRKLCHFESEGGVCNDPGCRNVHLHGFEPQGGDVESWLKAVFHMPTAAAAEHVDVLLRGLDVLLGRFSGPVPTLTLDSLYQEAYTYLAQVRPLT